MVSTSTRRGFASLLAIATIVAWLAAPERGLGASVPDLQLGAHGRAALALNRRLHELTYVRHEHVSSRFSRATFHAVVAFQKHERLARDGIVGPKTRKALLLARRPRPILDAAGRRIEVSLSRQLAFLVRRGIVLRTIAVSTGKRGYGTPRGDFAIYRRERLSWSMMYRVMLPWAAYFHRRGIAFHAFPRVPRYRASHGCVRVPPPFARELYEFARIGTPVAIR